MNMSSSIPKATHTTIKVGEFLPSPNMAAISSLVLSFVLPIQDCCCSSHCTAGRWRERRRRGRVAKAAAAMGLVEGVRFIIGAVSSSSSS